MATKAQMEEALATAEEAAETAKDALSEMADKLTAAETRIAELEEDVDAAETALGEGAKSIEEGEASLEDAIGEIESLELALQDAKDALAQAGEGLPGFIRYCGTGQVEGGWASPGLVRKNPPMGALRISHVVIDEAAYNAAPAHQKWGVKVSRKPIISRGC